WGLETADSVNLDEVVIFRDEDDGSLWVCPREEFSDQYFQELSPALPIETAQISEQSVGEERADTIDALRSELDAAIEVAWNHGATKWVETNHPHYARKRKNEAHEIAKELFREG